jgi:ATP synthase protein I
MPTIAPGPEVEASDADFKPLTADEARQLREKHPPLSPWRVIAGQCVVGLLVALAAWGLTGSRSVGWSAGYGALAVVLPAVMFARGLTSRVSSMNPGAAVFGFFLWEMVKIALTVAMLFAAPRLVSGLSWPAMLVGLVVTMKVVWVALVFKDRFRAKHTTN